MKRHPLILASLALLGLAALAPVAGAQDPVGRVQFALDLTQRRIEQAEALLASTDNERARAELNLAVTVQAEANRVFGGGTNPVVFPQVMRLTLEARAHADRAIAIVKGLPDPDCVQIQLERTREVI